MPAWTSERTPRFIGKSGMLAPLNRRSIEPTPTGFSTAERANAQSARATRSAGSATPTERVAVISSMEARATSDSSRASASLSGKWL